jgi:hypothetical protein
MKFKVRLVFLYIFFALSPTIIKAQQRGAEFLIIAPDSFVSDLQAFAEWKTKTGILTKIVPLSVTGTSSTQIKQYIQNAYNNWQIRPSFVLLAGGPNIIPYASVNGVYSDNFYGNMDSDIENEIIPGRIPARNRTQLVAAIDKILNYQINPFMQDTTWFIKGTVIVNTDNDPVDDSVYWSDARYVMNLMRNAGYFHIDSLSDIYGNNANDVHNRINDGRTFVLYRGQGVSNWYPPFAIDPNALNNGYKLPIVASITCRTINYGTTDSPTPIENTLLIGSPPLSVRGSVGVCATTTTRVSAAIYRSVLAKATFDAIFGGKTFGEACEEARHKLNTIYPGDQDVYGFTCLGDPTMLPWTGVPKRVTVDHPPLLLLDSLQNVTIRVMHNSTPVVGARVCIMQDTTIYIKGVTNYNGEFTFDMRPASMDTIYVTVTGRNILPYEGVIEVNSANFPYLTYKGYMVQDLNNNNQQIEPGESFLLWIRLKNYGSATSGVWGKISATGQDEVVVTDSLSYFGDFQYLEERENIKPFVIQLSPEFRNNAVAVMLNLWDTTGNQWNYQFQIPVNLPLSSITGPDQYGYYAYDNTDTNIPFAPQFNWIEIGNGLGTIIPRVTDADADTITISLPFVFKFYGIDYNSIGVSSNGYIEMGYPSDRRTGTNYPIPTAGGPRRFVAPFWYDLNPQQYGDIYQYFDTLNHRFIIEFKECAHYSNTNLRETFQIILFDPAYYSTPTGDGKILFQYYTVADASVCTVGIEDQTETRGLQYLYNGNYAQGATPLTNGRAILITTESPPPLRSPWIIVKGYSIDDSSGGNGNNTPEPGETFNLYLRFYNNGNDTIRNATITVSSESEVTFVDNSTSIPSLGPTEEYVNYSDPIVVSMSPAYQDEYLGLMLEIRGNNDGYFARSFLNIHIEVVSNVSEENGKPVLILTERNPFMNNLVLNFSGVSKEVPITIDVFDIQGRLLKSIASRISPNNSTIMWNGEDAKGEDVRAGVYFIKVKTPIYTKELKVIKLK